jgi:hypothetical protein
MQLEEQTAGIAKDRADLIASPERRRRRGTVLTCGLESIAVIVSHRGHCDCGDELSSLSCDKGLGKFDLC